MIRYCTVINGKFSVNEFTGEDFMFDDIVDEIVDFRGIRYTNHKNIVVVEDNTLPENNVTTVFGKKYYGNIVIVNYFPEIDSYDTLSDFDLGEIMNEISFID